MLGPVADWMNRQFPTLQTTVTLSAARAFLVEHAAPDALVIDGDGRLVGAMTDYEILKAELLGEAGDSPIEQWVGRHVWTISATDDLLAVAARFREGRCSLAAVIEDGKLIGGLRRQDVLRAIDTLRQQTAPCPTSSLRLDRPESSVGEPATRRTELAFSPA